MEVKDLTTTRKGAIGELIVKTDLIKNYNIYSPEVDDDEVDLIVEVKPKVFQTVNVKYIHKAKTKTSIEVRFGRKHPGSKRVDVMAVVYEPIGVAYLPYQDMGAPQSINLALYTAANNQDKHRHFFYQFMRYPEFE